jgi:hypothetical protein
MQIEQHNKTESSDTTPTPCIGKDPWLAFSWEEQLKKCLHDEFDVFVATDENLAAMVGHFLSL